MLLTHLNNDSIPPGRLLEPDLTCHVDIYDSNAED